jgi:hypothetical protein
VRRIDPAVSGGSKEFGGYIGFPTDVSDHGEGIRDVVRNASERELPRVRLRAAMTTGKVSRCRGALCAMELIGDSSMHCDWRWTLPRRLVVF